MTSFVSITLQSTDEARSIIDAIVADNPEARVQRFPAMVKIDCPWRMVINRATVEENIGRDFPLHELNVSVIALSGNVDEEEDSFTLSWNA